MILSASKFLDSDRLFCCAVLLQISYGDRMVMPGDVLSIHDIAEEPKVQITQCSHSGVYSLLMLDPDMPSPSKPDYK